MLGLLSMSSMGKGEPGSSGNPGALSSPLLEGQTVPTLAYALERL